MANTEQYKWIFDGIENIDSIRPHGFVAKRHRGSLQLFELDSVNTEYFRTKIIKKLEQTQTELNDKEITIKNFPQEVTDEKTVWIIDAKKYESIQKTINDVFDTNLGDKYRDHRKHISKIKYSAMLFDIPNEKSIITIDFISIYNKKTTDIGLVASYDDSGLHEITKGDVFTFKSDLPCIYFEEVEKLIVFDLKKTEQIFNLIEHYRKNARKQFEMLVKKNIIDIDNDVLETSIKNITTAYKINRMIEHDAFDMTIKEYEEYIKFFKTHKDIRDKVSKLLIRDNKVIIHNDDDFKAFLYWTDYAIQQSVINPNKIFVVHGKREINKIV